jgi:hypothetical protein
MKRAILITVLCVSAGALLLPACATTSLLSDPVTSTKIKETELGTDTIRAIGYPTNNGEKKEGVVLLGNKFTYWLTSGSDMVTLMANLDAKYIEMESTPTFAIKDKTFSGTIKFQYNRTGATYSKSERDILSKLCLVGQSEAPKRCWINISGALYLPAQQVAEGAGIKNLDRKPTVRLVTQDGTVTEVDAATLASTLFVFPFAVAFDVVTSPVQVPFLLLWFGSSHP